MTSDARDSSDSEDDASPLELFFDLVFVFALEQLSVHLYEHLGWRGAAETLVLLVAVYAVWSATTFAAMLPEVRRTHAQWLVLAVMLLGLFMNAAVLHAWKDGALWFVVPYLVCRLGHAVAAVALNPEPASRGYLRGSLGWIAVSAPLWVAGALIEDHSGRLVLWALAAALDLIGTWLAHPAPRRMRGEGDLAFDADRLVERCRLFLLVALGETVLTTGLSLTEAPQEGLTVLTGSLAFISVVGLWMLYFGSSDQHVERDLDHAGDALLTARRVLASQFVVVAGLIALAVGLEVIIAHPSERTTVATALVLCGGAVLYVLVQAWYLTLVAGGSPVPRLVGAGALALAVPVALLLPGVAALGLVAGILAVQAVATLRGPGAVG